MRSMKWLACAALLVASCAELVISYAQAPVQTPENQVFQFAYTATRSDWADKAKTTATAYLWIPEQSKRLRGLLIFGTNVPEHMLVGNAEIRAVAAANDLGIVWSSPSFWYSKGKNEYPTLVAFLQQLLDGLAQVSGYEEVATVPWLPLGESGHLLMVDALVEAAPQRCIAGMWLKNPHLPPHNRTVPAFVVFGTAQEWSQDKADYTELWKDPSFYNEVIAERKKNPEWPLTFMMDGTSGHFDVSATLVHILAHYIDAVAKARLPREAETAMRPVDLRSGFLADLPVPGHTRNAVQPYSAVPANARALPWFFDRQEAIEAQTLASINWRAQSQLIGFTEGSGKVLPFDFNGITGVTPTFDADGITFHIRPILLDKLPDNFLHAGQPLAKVDGTPTLEWECGAVTPAGGDALRVSMDRSYRQQAIYYVARMHGGDTARAVVQPIGIKIQPNNDGKPQHIDFTPIPDVPLGTTSVALHATSDQRMPVGFYVVSGPAKIIDGKVVFTPIPPRATFPVSVTVAAWQWGRASEPKIKTAETVKQTFLIVAK